MSRGLDNFKKNNMQRASNNATYQQISQTQLFESAAVKSMFCAKVNSLEPHFEPADTSAADNLEINANHDTQKRPDIVRSQDGKSS